MTLSMAMFFSFGALAQLTQGHFALALMVVVLAGLVYSMAHTRSQVEDLTAILNTVALCIVAVVGVSIAHHLMTRPLVALPATPLNERNPEQPLENLPDIYYIILDGYGRADVLESMYGYDNSEFLDQLHQRGFRVCECSLANYITTPHSLASSFNVDYLDRLVQETGITGKDLRPLLSMLNASQVVQSLKSSGYLFVSFASGWDLTESLSDVDLRFRPPRALSELEVILLARTPIPWVDARLPGRARHCLLHPYEYRRSVIRYALNHLADPRASAQPVFVFAHIVCPHPPFVFGPDGTPREPDRIYNLADVGGDFIRAGGTHEEYVQGYRDQLIFLNDQLLEAIDRIAAASVKPAIVVLQGDHGPAAHGNLPEMDRRRLIERQAILNAYLVPDKIEEQLYDGVTPVNTFRLILNYLGITDYELLDDRCYLSSYNEPYQFIDVTDKVSGPQ